MQKKDKVSVRKGQDIKGKWQKNSYTILRSIGSGTIGTVYVCRHNGKLYALKMGKHPTALVREVNMLKRLNKVRHERLGPFLLDVDDWEVEDGETYPFYVMEYIQGISIETYVKRHGTASIDFILVDLLQQLEQLHHSGFVYGDLKNENIVITTNGIPKVRLIDVGGVTKIGQSVREYSGFYDRSYWQLGSRKAEPSYDLFAVVMICLTIFYPKQFRRANYPRQQIMKALQRIPALQRYLPVFKKALYQTYPTADAMQKEIERIQKKRQNKKRKDAEPLMSQAIIMMVFSLGFWLLDYFL